MAESRVIINRPNSSSPPPNCAICLGTCTNKCFSDSCMHQFCFKCLLEWSKIKPECPLCKQAFRRIIHNVKSNEEYDEHVVDITPPEEIHIIDNEEFFVLPLARHQFHFRTTFTVDTRGEHAIQQMLLTHPLTNGGQISIEGYPSRRRCENNTSTSFRRSIYTRNMWVRAPPDVTGRYRDVSPTFFRNCPGARARLVPWLNRELNALLYENTLLVRNLVDIIMNLLLRYHICSRTFRNLLFEFLDNKTDHFVHEFYNFMRSPFDMIGYDRHIIYTQRSQPSVPYIDVSDNDNDSDVILVGTTNPEEPVVIDLVNTDSDEPILVSQEEPQLPLPMPERFPEPENRAPILPLKLRLKHKRQSREKEKEKKRQKRKLYRRRSTSPSSSSTSSSEDEYSKSSYERYKRRKKQKKLSKRRPTVSSSESDLNIDNTNSEVEDNLPLSVHFMNRKKSTKRLKKHSRSFKNHKYSTQPSTSHSTKDSTKKETDRIPQVQLENLPSCSKYSSDSSSTPYAKKIKIKSSQKDRSKEQVEGTSHINGDSLESANLPTCSKYVFCPNTSSHEGSNEFDLNIVKSDRDTSNAEDDYPLTHLVKSEVREVRSEEKCGGPSGSSSNNGRLRNVLIKREVYSNSWYPEPSNYDTDSSEN